MIWAIALNTYRELVRGKILYIVLFFAFSILMLSTFFGTVTVGDQVKVIKDFGLFCISIFSIAFIVISGSSLLNKELSKKTIYNILAKSVTRSEFLTGKFLGIFFTAAVMILMMGLSLYIYLYFFEDKFDNLILLGLAYFMLEALIISATTILFSTIVVTPVLVGFFAFGVFLAGRSHEYLLYFIQNGMLDGFLSKLISALNTILPNLNKLNIINDIVYANTANLGTGRLFWSSIYSLSYACIMLVLGGLILRNKNLS